MKMTDVNTKKRGSFKSRLIHVWNCLVNLGGKIIFFLNLRAWCTPGTLSILEVVQVCGTMDKVHIILRDWLMMLIGNTSELGQDVIWTEISLCHLVISHKKERKSLFQALLTHRPNTSYSYHLYTLLSSEKDPLPSSLSLPQHIPLSLSLSISTPSINANAISALRATGKKERKKEMGGGGWVRNQLSRLFLPLQVN